MMGKYKIEQLEELRRIQRLTNEEVAEEIDSHSTTLSRLLLSTMNRDMKVNLAFSMTVDLRKGGR